MVECLYIHIPFCIKKCIYCDFYSIPFNPRIVLDYVTALCREIELTRDIANNLKTIYIGGGTPTILSGCDMMRILNASKENYSIDPDAEITIESNPRTISVDKAERLLNSGINRISLGVQSFVDEELMILGRVHGADDAIKAVRDVRGAGFENISIDLIYGIPEQNLSTWRYTISKAIELSPTHISIYELTPERGTPLYEHIKNGRLTMPEEGVIVDMYYEGISMLESHGYLHYEISNLSRPGYECRHNLNYWGRGEYLGIGAGAHSFFSGRRMSSVRDISHYIEGINDNRIPVVEDHYITDEDALKEFILLGMRKTDGVDQRLLPREKRVLMKKAVEDLASNGLVEVKDNHFRLTRKGLLLSNEVIVQVLLSLEGCPPS